VALIINEVEMVSLTSYNRALNYIMDDGMYFLQHSVMSHGVTFPKFRQKIGVCRLALAL
jgi:hypothetical protein